MNVFNTIAILAVACLAVFAQATFNEWRHWFGLQIDLLPSLVVYASLSGGVVMLSLVAVCGGLWLDSMSANPIGVSVLPLFLTGLFIQRSRDMILRNQPFAQFVLGASASAAVPLFTLLLLINLNTRPLVGWFSLWQWLVMSPGLVCWWRHSSPNGGAAEILLLYPLPRASISGHTADARRNRPNVPRRQPVSNALGDVSFNALSPIRAPKL